jgi:sodium-dependent dicarboxylate transporter 2/3/5
MIAVVVFATGYLTNLIPNTAMAALIMPLLGSVALAAQIDPAVLMMPAVLAASCAFMLPVGTMPNAIVYGSGYVTVKNMATEGFFVNLFTAAIITVLYYFLLPMFGFSM